MDEKYIIPKLPICKFPEDDDMEAILRHDIKVPADFKPLVMVNTGSMQLKVYESLLKGESSVCETFEKIRAEVLDMHDRTLVDAVVNFAKDEGYTTLYLMDKEFITAAIKHELERRGLTNGDQENNKT